MDEPVDRKTEWTSVAESALEPGEEVVSERTASGVTTATDEVGVFETRLYSAPVHYQEDGEWEKIVTDFEPEAGKRGADARVVNGANSFDVSVAAKADDEQLARVDLGEDASVAWGVRAATDGERAAPVQAAGRSVERGNV